MFRGSALACRRTEAGWPRTARGERNTAIDCQALFGFFRAAVVRVGTLVASGEALVAIGDVLVVSDGGMVRDVVSHFANAPTPVSAVVALFVLDHGWLEVARLAYREFASPGRGGRRTEVMCQPHQSDLSLSE